MNEAEDHIARERIAALDRRVTEQMAAQERATQIAMVANEKAVLKAETASERRFESVNEFRQTLSDQAAKFVTRTEAEALFAGAKEAIARLENQAAATSGKGAGADNLWRILTVAVGLLIAASGFVLALTKGMG